MAAAVMTNLNSRQRDEFLKALEEARRAAMAGEGEPPASPKLAGHGIEFRHAIDRMTGRLRSYISAGLLARLYSDAISRPRAAETPPAPAPSPPKSEHEQVVDELHLTSDLTAPDLKLLRRKFAKINHPDRVAPGAREQASRRMTIANALIDEALSGTKARAQ